jgi:mRNA-degrading endonuclease RelE of RelBE toxin-antitoxin system/DNA-binding XRE family transcriptional regulator
VATVTYTQSALKVLSRLQPKLTARIVDKIEQFAADPRSQANNVMALAGSPYIRLRVGDWRVIMDDQGNVLLVLQIGPRGDIHRQEASVQIITTPNGESLVILPLADYERLVDQADIARANRIKRAVASGEEEVVPAAIVRRLIAGENKVKVWRSHRGLSGRDLAAAAGVSAPFISEIESGRKDGSVSVMKKIAEALKVDLDDLV